MINKSHSQKGSSHIIIVIIFVLVLIGALGFIYWNNFARKSPAEKDSAVSDTRPDIENVLTLSGTVTKIRGSCHSESIYPEEDTRADSICDGGDSIRVGDKTIETSTGGAGPGFNVNTDFIHLGDTVSVKYVDNKGYGSLNCSKCSITVIKSVNQQN